MDNYFSKKIIFLCGLHRSGTSVTFQILKNHPDISGFENTGVPEDEGQHLQTVFSTAKEFGGPGIFGFSEKAYLNEKSSLLTTENKRKLLREWGEYWNMEKEVLLEKSPPNLIRTRFLQSIFENAIFVTIIRHPIATSLATQKWSGTSLMELVNHWLICHDKFMDDSKFLKRSTIFKYEDFVNNPEATMEEIYSFANLDMAPINKIVLPMINDKYFGVWNKYRNSIFTRREANRIIDKYEEKIRLYGYSFIDLK